MLPPLLILTCALTTATCSPVDNDSVDNRLSERSPRRFSDTKDMLKAVADHRPYDAFDYMAAQSSLSYRRNLQHAASDFGMEPALRKMYREWLDEISGDSESNGDIDDNEIDEDHQISSNAHESLIATDEATFRNPLSSPLGYKLSLTTDMDINIRESDLLLSVKARDELAEKLEAMSRKYYNEAGRKMPVAHGLTPPIFNDLGTLPNGDVEVPRLRNLVVPYYLLQAMIRDDTPEVDSLYHHVVVFMNSKLPYSDEQDVESLTYQPPEHIAKDSKKDTSDFLYMERYFDRYYYMGLAGIRELMIKMTELKPRISLMKHNLCIANSIFYEITELKREYGPDSLRKFTQIKAMAENIKVQFEKMEPLFKLMDIYSFPENETGDRADAVDKTKFLDVLLADSANRHRGLENGWIPAVKSLFELYQVEIPKRTPEPSQQRIILNELIRLHYTNLIANSLKLEFAFLEDASRLYARFVILIVSLLPDIEKLGDEVSGAIQCLQGFQDELRAKQDMIMKRADKKLIVEWDLYVDKKTMKGRVTKDLGQCHRNFRDYYSQYYHLTEDISLAEVALLKVLKPEVLTRSRSITNLMKLNEKHIASAQVIMNSFNTFKKYRLI